MARPGRLDLVLGITFLASCLQTINTDTPVSEPTPGAFCRDSWIKNLSEANFANLTCSKCLIQLFANKLPYTIFWPPRPPYGLLHKFVNASIQEELIGDPESYPSVVCNVTGLGVQQCARWRECCLAARRCCKKMLQWTPAEGTGRCPGTWDGVACWDSSPPGEVATQHCPVYYAKEEALWTSPHAQKTCTVNGSWEVHPIYKVEMTDYVPCVDVSAYQRVVFISLYIDIAGNVISVIALVTSIAVILGFRSLRRDLLSRDGLKLHLNLFVAMILAGLASLALHYIYFDKNITRINPVWCRILNAVSKYFRSVTFIAVFSEGLYLHRRISRVLYVSRREPLLKYFLISWIVPAITVIAYSITRIALDQNKGCWMRPANSELEFIYMVPNAVTMLCNMGFLISIEVNLCTKMRTDSSDRRVEVLRHALRATLTLFPMFGLQFFFFAYRPRMWPPYEIIHALFISTQGFLVAVVYCLSTKEVRSQLFLVGKHCTLRCGELCSRSSGHGAGRRESSSSALRERSIDPDGYLYMYQRQAAKNSPSYLAAPRRQGRCSLPDVIDSVSMTQATRTTSLASSLSDLKDRAASGGALSQSRRQSSDAGTLRRPSAMSLTLPCSCGGRSPGGRGCTCGAMRTSLLSPHTRSEHGSTTSCDAGVILDEREEDTSDMQLEHGEGVGRNSPLLISNNNHVDTCRDQNHKLADVAL